MTIRLIVAERSIPSRFRRRAAPVCASERTTESDESTLMKCYTNFLSPDEPN
jgi:hypothetical protein